MLHKKFELIILQVYVTYCTAATDTNRGPGETGRGNEGEEEMRRDLKG